MTYLYIFLGVSISIAYDNVALNKPTYQQHRYFGLSEDLVNANNAVDGLKSNLSVWGGQCVISGNKMQTATWWVNLTSILSIHHITIYYRTGNVEWGTHNGFTGRFLGFSVFVSNSTDTSDGTLCFKDTNFTLKTIPPVLNITCLLHGQYVIYYNERLPGITYPDGYSTYAYNELCELEVYGCPEPGYYGSNCSVPCPDPNCRYCHLDTGTCQICEPGYEGHRCESECQHGKYGYRCEMTCGHCEDKKNCDRANGTCLRGCKQGYLGEDCKYCETRHYGEGCNITCGHCLNNAYCHHGSGACLLGCDTGYHGKLCKSYNLAFNKPTYQQYPYTGFSPNLTEAANAVDGLRSNLSVWSGQCAISDEQKHNATWWVNLTSILSIRHITIYYRTGDRPWGISNSFTSRFLGFSLYISNTTNKSDGILCFKDTTFTRSTIPAVFSTNCFVHGQYVIYYNERTENVTYPNGYSTFAYNELCEVEVFGCLESGYYGPDCSTPCPDPHCRYCHLETGFCQGCEAGFEGHHCELECANGKYGFGCENSCGRCTDFEPCYRVNGTCLNGCEKGYTGETCKFCENGNYGQSCNTPCGHCLNQDYCHHDNGVCLSGCDPGYHGKQCKSYNLAFNMPTYQQYRYKGLPGNITGASNAVDGLRSNLSVFAGQCVISEEGSYNATWWVNLTNIHSIHHITIYYRTGNKKWGITNDFTTRFLGFSLYVSNTTNKSQGTLCFHDTNFTLDTIPAVFNTTCPVLGQYVIYYNERLPNETYPDEYSTYAYNELCEVEVFGCPETGYYGPDCSLSCPDPNCRYCHLETGVCQGCEPGYEGHHCELKCVDEGYRVVCRPACGHCKKCNHTSETCLNGCEEGYRGDTCMQKCDGGTYGFMCSEVCGECKSKQTCHSVNGKCQSGCKPGFYGDLCKMRCPFGFFGDACSETCNNTCAGCNNSNGICDTGCLPGWKGKYCEEPETTKLLENLQE
uniref:Cell death abnormality protein 1-like isoform X1 n=1 Tax=Crassostrea virginica TaxID=6565 RepID=A0A8B8C1B5_CRAVI|nr:cell death abnormality protein 1-like isoform X1 [Crassostrea virginica]